MPLQPLRDIAAAGSPGSFDLRTWPVIAHDGSALGTVAEVIVDVETESPVYLQVVAHDHPDGKRTECWIGVPYRHVDIDEDARRVVMSDIALLGLGSTTTERLR